MSNTKRYWISVDGCDDSTFFKMDLTEEEIATLQKVANICNGVSECACMPTIDIRSEEKENDS